MQLERKRKTSRDHLLIHFKRNIQPKSYGHLKTKVPAYSATVPIWNINYHIQLIECTHFNLTAICLIGTVSTRVIYISSSLINYETIEKNKRDLIQKNRFELILLLAKYCYYFLF